MPKIKGISQFIIDSLVDKTNDLRQGRGAGCLGFIDDEGFISSHSNVVGGGLNGLPFRQLLDQVVEMKGLSFLEGIERLPQNTVVIGTSPGKTGLITDTGGINIFTFPMVNIGIKEDKAVGVGIIYPKPEFFDLATRAEEIKIELLAARNMEEEKEMLRASNKMSLKYLEMSSPLKVVDRKEKKLTLNQNSDFEIPRVEVSEVDAQLTEELIERSNKIGQGREVAVMGLVEDGRVVKSGEIVEGGMGYIPSRLLASSLADVQGKSLREVYAEVIPYNTAVVHTHPGGTGVMHTGDAMAGPGTWARPIVAVGHDKNGTVRGATVIEKIDEVYSLADEDEAIGQEFFRAETPTQEAELRKRRFGIAQEYTDLCKPVEIK